MNTMKKLLLPLAVAISPFAYGGGDIAPVDVPVVDVPSVDSGAWYLGLGVSTMNLTADLTDEKMDTIGGTLQAGYKYNDYIGAELRYTQNVSKIEYDPGNTVIAAIDDYPADFTNVGIYLKPSYPIGNFSLYGLVGYGSVTFTNLPQNTDDRTEGGFQWGAGASYNITDCISIFADYTNVYNDTGIDGHFVTSDITIEFMTVGVSYKF
jgi:opacity protein-like surface antigen